MTIRTATNDDIAIIMNLADKIYTESRFNHLIHDKNKVERGLKNLINSQQQGRHLILLAYSADGKVIGGFVGTLEEYFFTSDISANSILIWVDSHYRGSSAAIKLIDVFKQWAITRGAKEINIAVSSGIKIGSTDRFVRRLGFVQTGGNYSMVLG